MLTANEILTHTHNSLPMDFETLKPEQKLHFLVKGVIESMEQKCDLVGNYLLANGDLTLIQLLTDESQRA